MSRLFEYIEGREFRGSRRMPIDDVVLALPVDAVGNIPGLLPAHALAVKRALRDVTPVGTSRRQVASNAPAGATIASEVSEWAVPVGPAQYPDLLR